MKYYLILNSALYLVDICLYDVKDRNKVLILYVGNFEIYRKSPLHQLYFIILDSSSQAENIRIYPLEKIIYAYYYLGQLVNNKLKSGLVFTQIN